MSDAEYCKRVPPPGVLCRNAELAKVLQAPAERTFLRVFDVEDLGQRKFNQGIAERPDGRRRALPCGLSPGVTLHFGTYKRLLRRLQA